eukprot:scaffold1414_cov384-Prasinococcus_capsulatus_cf.AAC.13
MKDGKFCCTHPGCKRTFNAQSNLARHLRLAHGRKKPPSPAKTPPPGTSVPSSVSQEFLSQRQAVLADTTSRMRLHKRLVPDHGDPLAHASRNSGSPTSTLADHYEKTVYNSLCKAPAGLLENENLNIKGRQVAYEYSSKEQMQAMARKQYAGHKRRQEDEAKPSSQPLLYTQFKRSRTSSDAIVYLPVQHPIHQS